MNFVVITTLLFFGLRVTYMYLYSFVLTLFSISVLYLLCDIVYLKANNFSGVGVSHFSTSSAVALWPFLVATPFVWYKFVVGECTYMFEIMSDLFQCICLSYTPLVVFIYIYRSFNK